MKYSPRDDLALLTRGSRRLAAVKSLKSCTNSVCMRSRHLSQLPGLYTHKMGIYEAE
jgi:hypothetical protein